jgi:hypothetical protein
MDCVFIHSCNISVSKYPDSYLIAYLEKFSESEGMPYIYTHMHASKHIYYTHTHTHTLNTTRRRSFCLESVQYGMQL